MDRHSFCTFTLIRRKTFFRRPLAKQIKDFLLLKAELMNRNLIILTAFLLLSACCKDTIEEDKFFLTDYDRAAIPYTLNQTIPFKHSNGFEFDLAVTGIDTQWETTDTKHCGDSYSSFEIYKVELKSIIPELHINIQVFPKEINRHMNISINSNAGFGLNYAAQPDMDTLILNGIEYYDVYQTDSFWSDSLTIRPMSILYNKEIGILQITTTANETFTIDQ